MYPSENRQSIILMGLKHSGKSSLGRFLAESRGWEFLDLDDLLLVPAEKEWEKRGQTDPLTCRNLYKYSPDLFREMEYLGARRAAELMDLAPAVLALGGGTMENSRAMEVLREHGRLVYLSEDPAVLYERILAGGLPPFLDRSDPWSSFLEIHRRRDRCCLQWADITLPLEGADLAKAGVLLNLTLTMS